MASDGGIAARSPNIDGIWTSGRPGSAASAGSVVGRAASVGAGRAVSRGPTKPTRTTAARSAGGTTSPATRRARNRRSGAWVGVGWTIIGSLGPTFARAARMMLRRCERRGEGSEGGEQPVDVGLRREVVHDPGAQERRAAQGRGGQPAVAGGLERGGEPVLVRVEAGRVHRA